LSHLNIRCNITSPGCIDFSSINTSVDYIILNIGFHENDNHMEEVKKSASKISHRLSVAPVAADGRLRALGPVGALLVDQPALAQLSHGVQSVTKSFACNQKTRAQLKGQKLAAGGVRESENAHVHP
jgi:hypothetical protein